MIGADTVNEPTTPATGPCPVAADDPRGGSRTGRERRLLRDLEAGDRSAAEALVEGSYQTIYRSLLRMTGGRAELAADLTQETYRRAWAALPSFKGDAAFTTWVYRIAYTTFLNHLRRPRPVEPLEAEQAETMADDEPGPERLVLAGADADALRRAVMGLPEDLRYTVTARFWGELPVREIARQTDLSTVGVRKRLKRAFDLLRASLEDVPS
jgi:RNA polymerase sigma-70 factor, ECF subfamily